MSISWARRITIILIIFTPILIVGMSVVLLVIQARHGQVIEDEVHAVRTLEVMDRVTILFDRQRLNVAQAPYRPFDESVFRTRAQEFRALLGDPNLLVTADGRRLQRQTLMAYDVFVSEVLTLPPAPTPTQVQNIQAQADRVISPLDELRVRHTTDLRAVTRTEQEQRRLSFLLALVTNVIILLFVILGFVLLARLSKQRAEAAALRATDQLRNEFVAFTAHELRNPASAIKTGASLLRDPDIDPDIRMPVVESINRSADALVRLVTTLLAMGRLEEGRLHLQRKPMLLSTVFTDLLEELEPYHPGIATRIHCSLPTVEVAADAEYLKLAIANILDNAIKHAPPQSPITINGDSAPEVVTVHIHNEGAGIALEVLPHIFEKYETTGTAPYSSRSGVGLGLYMTRLLIEAHGGTIWAESVPGQGVTISFTLPVSNEPPVPERKPPLPSV